MFVPHENRLVYRRITAFIVVFDAGGDVVSIREIHAWLHAIKKRREHFTVLQMADQEENFFCFRIVYIVFSV